MGRWFEISRFDNWVQKGADNVSETYTMNPDGTIKVADEMTKNGKYKLLPGGMEVMDKKVNTKLGAWFFVKLYRAEFWIVRNDN